MRVALDHLNDVLGRHYGRSLAAIGGLASGVAVAVYLTGLLHSVVARLWTVDDVAVRSLAVVRASGDIGDADARFFNARDLRRLRLYLPDAVWIRPIYAAQQVLTACGRSDFVMLLGIDSGVERLLGWKVDSGRALRWSDEAGTTPAIVVSNGLAEREGCRLRLGTSVMVGRRPLTVVGVASRRERALGVDQQHSVVVMTARLFERLYSDATLDRVQFAAIRFPEGLKPGSREWLIQAALTADVHPGKKRTVHVETAESMNAMMQQVASGGSVILIALVGLSVVIAVVGIGTTVLIGALERRGEIGLKRCLGARRDDVAAECMSETLALVAGGCVMGSGAGLLLLCATCDLAGLRPELDLPRVGVMLAFSFGLGSMAGVVPALWAAKIEPARAMGIE